MIRIIFLLLLYSPIGAFYCSSALSARHGSFPCCFTIWSQPVQPSAALFLSSIEEENGTIRPVKKPIVRRKPVKRVGRQFWTPEEDELLKEDAKLAELINIHGPSWPLIASLMDGRTYHQCYHRWNYHLNPDNKMLWKKEEDEIIRFFVKQSQREGNREPVWSALLPLLPGRSLEEVTKRYETVEKDEEELLVKTVLECKALKKRFTWSEVARRLSIGKSAEACNGHWRYYQRRLKELQMRNENITNT
eukprot:gene3539-3876_t